MTEKDMIYRNNCVKKPVVTPSFFEYSGAIDVVLMRILNEQRYLF